MDEEVKMMKAILFGLMLILVACSEREQLETREKQSTEGTIPISSDGEDASEEFVKNIPSTASTQKPDGQEESVEETEESSSSASECSLDQDCARAGCSGQLCVLKDKADDIMTTCEFRPEYAHQGEKCGCWKGKCAWIAE